MLSLSIDIADSRRGHFPFPIALLVVLGARASIQFQSSSTFTMNDN